MKLLTSLLFALIFSLSVLSQDLTDDFKYKKEGSDTAPVYQVLPNDDKLLDSAELGAAYQSLGIITQPENDSFGLVFTNAQQDFQFDAQQGKPFVLLLGETKISSSNVSVIKKKRVKKLSVEVLTVKITREDFEKLLDAENVLIAYGDINYDVPQTNLSTFRYVGNKIGGRYARSTYTPSVSSPSSLPPTNSGGSVQVKGYYRKDGTYVRPHTRSAPGRRKP